MTAAPRFKLRLKLFRCGSVDVFNKLIDQSFTACLMQESPPRQLFAAECGRL